MARGDFPSSKQDQFVMRLPDGMRDTIKVRAAQNRRSMNAEIVTILETHLQKTETAAEREAPATV